MAYNQLCMVGDPYSNGNGNGDGDGNVCFVVSCGKKCDSSI